MRLSHPNWWTALRIAEAVLPGTTGLRGVDDLGGPERAHWVEVDIERTDEEIWGEISERVKKGLRDVLLVITDASYGSAGPMLIPAEDLDRAVSTHFDLFSDTFFGGDVVIVCPASGRVAIVHHNGLLAILDGKPTRAWGG